MKKSTALSKLQVKYTTANTKLSLLAGINRPIKAQQVTKLSESINAMGIIRPVVVSEFSFITGKKEKYIIDGQHLSMALLRNNMNIPYLEIKINNKQQRSIIENIANAYLNLNLNKQYKNRFLVKMGDNIISIKTDDVFHFTAEDGITLMVTSNNKRYPIDYTLDQLEGAVSPDLFFRINRKVLISMNSIQKVSSYFNSRLKINSDILEEDADSIDIKSLQGVAKDPKGLMNLYEYEISLRKDPKWRYTKNAQDSLSSIARDMTKMFGLGA
jgi:hypothetical protein